MMCHVNQVTFEMKLISPLGLNDRLIKNILFKYIHMHFENLYDLFDVSHNIFCAIITEIAKSPSKWWPF